MSYLLDTGVLLRWAQSSLPENSLTRLAVRRLKRSGEILYVTPQNLVEFWSVSTRPATARGGFDLSPEQADEAVSRLERAFRTLEESSIVYRNWRRLVRAYRVSGRQVHDTRLVAVMLTHKVDKILTFNPDDFKRFTEITAVHPKDVA